MAFEMPSDHIADLACRGLGGGRLSALKVLVSDGLVGVRPVVCAWMGFLEGAGVMARKGLLSAARWCAVT